MILSLQLKNRVASLALAAVSVLLFTGCRATKITDPVIGAGYEPKNVYSTFDTLSVGIRRVAVLPPTAIEGLTHLQSGLETMAPILIEELNRTTKFEVVVVTPEQLRAWTGRTHWRAEETLPADFLVKLQKELRCDGVLFSRLTQYRPFPPLAVGWNLKLAEVATEDLVWVVDEVFDANNPRVVNSARRYQLEREQLPWQLSDSRSILNSPSGFGRYAAISIFETLPSR